jgi:hypothetical protein
VSVYDGARMIGRIVQRGRECVAFTWPADVNLGEFKNRQDAADAITVADAISRAGRQS